MVFSLTGRWLTIIGGGLVTAICIAAGWLIMAQRADVLADAWQATGSLARVLAEQTALTIQPVDLTLRDLQGRLEATAPHTAEAVADALGSKATFDILNERLKSLPQADALFVAGADGRLLNSTRQFPPAPRDLTGREVYDYLKDHDDHAMFVSQPVKIMSSGKLAVLLGRRINAAHGVFAGIAVADLTLASLQDFYKAVTPAFGTVTLLRRDGTILVHYPPAPTPASPKLPPAAGWYRVLDQGGGTYTSPGFLSGMEGPVLVAVQPMRDFPLVVDASTFQIAALMNWRVRLMWIVAGAVFASACVILLLRVFGRQFARLTHQNDQLENGRARFDAVLDAMSQGLTFFDRDDALMVCNRRYAEIYRLTPDQISPGTSLLSILGYRIAAGSFPDMRLEDYLGRRAAMALRGEPHDVTDILRDGRTVAMRYQPMRGGGWVATHEDITERSRTEASLLFMARHDAMTELPNRALFEERLTQALAAARPGSCCAVICLDVDGFKVVNDTLGRPIGDALLRAVAKRLVAAVREIDMVACLGGDNFAILQSGIDTAEAAANLAGRIITLVQRPYDIDGHRIVIGASAGVSVAPADGIWPDKLLQNADIALYLAKQEGRGAFRFFEPEMNARVQGRRVLEFDLRRALPADDFSLHYQPILDLASDKVVAFEALIRWNHPDRGLVGPSDFIPIAEDTGLIVPIGQWALKRACREAVRWPDNLDVAVNLSPVQFQGAQLFDAVRDALTESGLDPKRLILEITESVLLRKSEGRLALLHSFRALGIRIALDDFGVGYSSLSYLCSFPFDKIKIDQSFIRDIDTSPESRIIAGAIMDLARGLGMTTTAEGVETRGQLETLRSLGCNGVQGYLFSRPLPAEEIPALIRTLQWAAANETAVVLAAIKAGQD